MGKALGLLGILFSIAGCPKTPPEPETRKAVDAAASTAEVGASVDAAVDSATADAPPPLLPDGGLAPPILGWDLDSSDPARDYVRRYVVATKRYGAQLECVAVGKSTRQGGGSRVEVRESLSATCKTKTAVKDVFLVDVAKDRLSVDDPSARAPLTVWPDGSKPGDNASPVFSINSINEWKTKMADTFGLLRLSPIRIQGYGRGSYLVVTLSGWRAPLARDAGDAKIKEALKKLCDANEGSSFAVASAIEPPTWLRANCGAGTYKWDKSPVWTPPP